MPLIGDIWLVNLGEAFPNEPAFVRPAVVVGPPRSFAGKLPVCFVVPLTTTARGLDLHVEIEASVNNGLNDTSYAQSEKLRSVSSARLVQKLGMCSFTELHAIRQLIRELLDLLADALSST